MQKVLQRGRRRSRRVRASRLPGRARPDRRASGVLDVRAIRRLQVRRGAREGPGGAAVLVPAPNAAARHPSPRAPGGGRHERPRGVAMPRVTRRRCRRRRRASGSLPQRRRRHPRRRRRRGRRGSGDGAGRGQTSAVKAQANLRDGRRTGPRRRCVRVRRQRRCAGRRVARHAGVARRRGGLRRRR